MFNGSVLYTDLKSMDMTEIASGLDDSSYAVSDSNQYLAWISDSDSREISIMDLETASVRQIHIKEGRTLRVLGFLQEDFVYGIAADSHRIEGASGVSANPMYALRIVSASSTEELKKYRKKGYYIDDVDFLDGVLMINRLVWDGSGYLKAQQDSIVNRGQEGEEKKIIHTTVTEVKQLQVQLTLTEMEKETPPVYIAAKQVMNQEDKKTSLKTAQEQRNYTAYAKGRVTEAVTDVGKAIRSADENMGVVVDEQQNYIWKRARKNVQLPLEVQPSEADSSGSPLAKCISAILRQEGIEVSVSELLERSDTPQGILESLLPERKVIAIEGCSLQQIFYYVSCGMPVLAVRGTQSAVLVTGYDALNVWMYDPQAGQTVKSTIEETEAQLEAQGTVYVAYL